ATCCSTGVLTAAITAAGFLLAGPTVAEPPLTGTARIVNGDTLEIAGQKVRLLGLDAPEGRQVCQRGGRPWRCREMVRRGMAVAYYPKRGGRGPTYDAEQADAEAVQRGLWSSAFLLPVDW
ncbi:MAG TPA: hypothetical protein PKA67_20170, partial [Amaricoccus sp.]|nr:hypothetical protein [Amaricoccus sp.]